MSNAERVSIRNVLILYLTSTILLVSIIGYSYYHYQTEQLQIKEKALVTQDAKKVFTKIQILHNNQFNKIIYPKFEEFNSAIYDIDKNLIFSTYMVKIRKTKRDAQIAIIEVFFYLVHFTAYISAGLADEG